MKCIIAHVLVTKSVENQLYISKQLRSVEPEPLHCKSERSKGLEPKYKWTLDILLMHQNFQHHICRYLIFSICVLYFNITDNLNLFRKDLYYP